MQLVNYTFPFFNPWNWVLFNFKYKICEVNKLNRNKPTRIGKTITVPIGQYKSQPKKIYYTIKRGDTLSGIAVKNKTSLSKIKKWNNIKDANKIKPGQKLVIYK